MVKYAPLERRGWHPLPEFLSNKKAVINIKNDVERCVNYALLYFRDRQLDANRHASRANLYSKQLFERKDLVNRPYPIAPNDVILSEDQFQININVFSIFEDEGRARHPLLISQTNYERVANLLYWKNHYAPIANISRLLAISPKENEST